MKANSGFRLRKAGGFTLIEMMTAVLIGAILMAIAVPSYNAQTQKSRRTEAKTALLDLAAREERYNSTYNTYTNDYTNPNEDVQGDGWTLLHWVYEGANRMTRIYRDGALVAGPFQHNAGVNTMGTSGVLGNAPGAFGMNMGLNAMLDEVRIIGVARSADWILAESIDQKTPTAFYSVGAEQTP